MSQIPDTGGIVKPDAGAPGPASTPYATWILWIFGAVSFTAVVLAVTPLTQNLDAIKITLQFLLAPVAWVLLAIAILRRQGAPIHPWIERSLAAWCLLGLLSTLLADFQWRAWQEWGFELCLIAAFAVVAATATTPRRFRGMCGFLYAVACLTVAFGLFHYFGGAGWLFAKVNPEGGPKGSPSGLHILLYTVSRNRTMFSTLLSRDLFAAFLVMVVPLSWAFFLVGRSRKGRLFFALSGFLFVLCILLTSSNDSTVALIGAMGIFGGLLVGERHLAGVPRGVRAIWGIGGVVLLATAALFLRADLASAFRNLGDAFHSRGIIWGGALGIAGDFDQPVPTAIRRFFLGSGPGGFMLLFPHYRQPDYWTAQITNTTLFAHSQPLGLLCERGILGLVAFAGFLGGILWLLFREIRRRRASGIHFHQAALLSALVGATIQNLTSSNTRWTVCGLTYWYVMGLAAASIRLSGATARKTPTGGLGNGNGEFRSNAAIVLLAASGFLAIVAVPFGVRRFLAEMSHYKGWGKVAEVSAAVERFNTATGSAKETHRADALAAAVEAEEHLKESLQWLPSFLPSLYQLGHTFMRHAALATDLRAVKRACRRGKETYERLLRYAPDYAEVHLGYGLHLQLCYTTSLDPRDADQALRHLKKAARMKSNLRTQWLYASALRELGRPEEALDIEGRILESSNETPRQSGDQEILLLVHKHLSEAAIEGGGRAELEPLLRRRLKDAPHDAESFTDLVESLFASGRDLEALELCVEWIERNPVDPLPRSLAVKILLEQNAGAEALLQMDALIEIQKSRRLTLAGPWALPAPGRVAELRDPDIGWLYLEAGRLADSAKLDKIAREYYEKCIQRAQGSDAARRAAEALKSLRDRR